MFIPCTVALSLLSSVISATALDLSPSHLVSELHRPGKRFIDGAGNYNITIVHVNDVHAHLDVSVCRTDNLNQALSSRRTALRFLRHRLCSQQTVLWGLLSHQDAGR